MSKRNSIPITIERIRERLDYNPETGILNRIWKGRSPKTTGQINYRTYDGYITLSLDGNFCLAHRIAWAHFYGEFPNGQIDHINRIKHDNRISNLRCVKPFENRQNTLKKKNNTTGFKGVSLEKSTGRFRARLKIKEKRINLGTYETPEEAAMAYIKGVKENCTHHPFQSVAK